VTYRCFIFLIESAFKCGKPFTSDELINQYKHGFLESQEDDLYRIFNISVNDSMLSEGQTLEEIAVIRGFDSAKIFGWNVENTVHALIEV
jgi:hypothetical protein